MIDIPVYLKSGVVSESMKHLNEFLCESIITEAATGVKLNSGENLDLIIDYLDKYLGDTKCIIPDSESVQMQNPKLQRWFCSDDISNALFFLKSNGFLCMYEPKVLSMTDSELSELSITRTGEKYQLPGIKAKLEPTSKKLNSAKTDLKIWPDKWDKYIVRGEHKVDETAKMPTTVIDFKNQGAYVLKNVSSIREDIFDSFKEKFGAKSVVTQLFSGDDFKKYLSGLDSSGKEEISSMMANVISEPLAIVALITNAEGVQDQIRREISSEDLGELYEIIIPIRQNWPVADFYAHFRNLPDRLIAISVKSNGPGNSSTILGCLPVANVGNLSASNSDSSALIDFFNELIPMFDTDKNVSLNVSDKLSGQLKGVSLYALSLLKKETENTRTSSADKLVNTFRNLINLTKKDKDLYTQLSKICDLGGTNVIEKFLVCLFNINPEVIRIIRDAVADAISCYKITVSNNGNVKCTKQSPDSGSFHLMTKQGGQSLKFTIENGKITDVQKGHKAKQGQWIGFTFH